MANVALDAYQGFCQHSFTSNEKSWVALSLNKSGRNEGKYDFAGDDFVLKTSVFTGLIDGDDYWLVAVLASGSCNPKEGSFEFKVWKNGADGAKGSFAKDLADNLAVAWQKDGCLALIHCNDIPVLKTAVKVLHELKMIVRPGSGEITVRLNVTTEQTPAIEEALCVFWSFLAGNEGNTPEPNTPAYEAAIVVGQAGLMSMPCLSNDELPNVVLYDLFGKKSGVSVQCFPFTGNLPSIEAVIVTLPKKEESKKRSGGNWGGSAAVDPKEVLKAREDFVITHFNAAGMTENAKSLHDVFEKASLKDGKLFLDFLGVVMGK